MISQKLKFTVIFLLIFKIVSINAQINLRVTDANGNVYKTIKIGKQIWMAENLKTTKYMDGESIPLVNDSILWANFETIGYCWYQNNETKFKNIYGALYNWNTLKTGKLCPTGWHVPSIDEWTILTNSLGDSTKAGCKLKEKGTEHWESPNKGATNEIGFNALPGGGRNFMGSFANIGIQGSWWSSTNDAEGTAWCIDLYYENCEVYKSHILVYKNMGLSVRCIKD